MKKPKRLDLDKYTQEIYVWPEYRGKKKIKERIFKSKEHLIEFFSDLRQTFLNKKKISIAGKQVYANPKLPLENIKKFNKGVRLTSVKTEASYYFITDKISDVCNAAEYLTQLEFCNKTNEYSMWGFPDGRSYTPVEVYRLINFQSCVMFFDKLLDPKALLPMQYVFGNEILTIDNFKRITSMLKSKEKETFSMALSLLQNYNIFDNFLKFILIFSYIDEYSYHYDDDDGNIKMLANRYMRTKVGKFLLQHLGEEEELVELYTMNIDTENDDYDMRILEYTFKNGEEEAANIALSDKICTILRTPCRITSRFEK